MDELDNKLGTAAKKVTQKSEELLQARRVQSNIAVVIAQLNLWLPVLTTYAKLKRQITDKR